MINPTKMHLFTLVVDLFVGTLPLPENSHVGSSLKKYQRQRMTASTCQNINQSCNRCDRHCCQKISTVDLKGLTNGETKTSTAKSWAMDIKYHATTRDHLCVNLETNQGRRGEPREAEVDSSERKRLQIRCMVGAAPMPPTHLGCFFF